MDFISNKEPQIAIMLKEIGIDKIEDLLSSIPESLRLPKPTHDDGLSEYEILKHMEALAQKNSYASFDNYLGAGAYEHHIPALTSMITSRSEFLTAYTPYQAEASQGMLQSIFEFQKAICLLTGMDVANASVYDGASACAEAVLMGLRINKTRTKVLVSETLHPHYRGVIEQYLSNQSVEIVTIPFKADGQLNLQNLQEDCAVLIVQYPNFLGNIEDFTSIFKPAHEKGIVTIICANPLVYGLYRTAAEIGADIAVGDCQPFGLPLHFGGPYVGYIATLSKHVRQLPGRIVGETLDTEGRTGYVLTLQAREQHIRREKATSNICTNQALAALGTLVTLLWYGKQGIYELALTNYQRTAYLKSELEKIPGVKSLNQQPFLNEFAIAFPKKVEDVLEVYRKEKIEPGLPLGNYYPELKNYLLVAVTETKNKQQLDKYVEIAKKMAGSA